MVYLNRHSNTAYDDNSVKNLTIVFHFVYIKPNTSQVFPVFRYVPS